MNQKLLKANLWKSKWHAALRNSISFGIPVVVLFWQKNGLSLTQVMILQSIFSILMVMLEIPSGYFADLFGRRKAMIYGSILMCLGTSLIGFSNSFWLFLSAEILLSTGFSFVSGADSALVYDSLDEIGQKESFKKEWGQIMSFMLATMVFMNFLGGLVAKIDLRYAFFVAIPFCIASIGLAVSMAEPPRHKKMIKKGYFKELMQVIQHQVYAHQELRLTVLFSAVLFVMFHTSLWLYNPYFEVSGLDLAWYGAIFAVFNVVASISSHYSHQIESKIGKKGSYLLMFGLLGFSHLLLGKIVVIASFIFAFGHQWVRGFYQVVMSDYIHSLTTSDIRATVMSVNNMVARLFYALSLPLFGWFADVYTIPQTFTMLGVLTLFFGLILYLPLKLNKVFEA